MSENKVEILTLTKPGAKLTGDEKRHLKYLKTLKKSAVSRLLMPELLTTRNVWLSTDLSTAVIGNSDCLKP